MSEIKITDNLIGNKSGCLMVKFEYVIDNQIAGFLEIELFDEKQFFSKYASPIIYMAKLHGKITKEDIDTKNYLKILKVLSKLHFPKVSPNLEEMNNEELEKEYLSIESILNDEFDWDIRQHFGHAIAQNVYVYENFRKKGVASELYKNAKEYFIKNYGVFIYASDLQREDGEALWKFFEKKGLVSYDNKGNKYLIA